MKRTGVLITLLTVGLMALMGTGLAQARTSIDSVASALRSNPVYNDPAAENALTAGQAADLRAQIEATGIPIYVAVLPASAAAASAPVAAAPAVPASSAAPSSALDQFMQAQPATDAPAWQALASAWGAALPAGADACTTLPREGLRCYRNRRAGLNLVRQIDRPVLLALYPSEEAEAPVSVLLRGLDGDNATLEGGGRSLRVPVAELAQVWRGEIATLWRAPVGMPDRGEITDSPAGAAWPSRSPCPRPPHLPVLRVNPWFLALCLKAP